MSILMLTTKKENSAGALSPASAGRGQSPYPKCHCEESASGGLAMTWVNEGGLAMTWEEGGFWIPACAGMASR